MRTPISDAGGKSAGVGAGGTGGFGTALPGTKAGHLDKRAGDFVKPRQGGAGAAFRGRSSNFLIDIAKGNGTIDDPTIRQDLMRLHSLNEIARYTTLRMKAVAAEVSRETLSPFTDAEARQLLALLGRLGG